MKPKPKPKRNPKQQNSSHSFLCRNTQARSATSCHDLTRVRSYDIMISVRGRRTTDKSGSKGTGLALSNAGLLEVLPPLLPSANLSIAVPTSRPSLAPDWNTFDFQGGPNLWSFNAVRHLLRLISGAFRSAHLISETFGSAGASVTVTTLHRRLPGLPRLIRLRAVARRVSQLAWDSAARLEAGAKTQISLLNFLPSVPYLALNPRKSNTSDSRDSLSLSSLVSLSVSSSSLPSSSQWWNGVPTWEISCAVECVLPLGM
jgi:hypothetical protein